MLTELSAFFEVPLDDIDHEELFLNFSNQCEKDYWCHIIQRYEYAKSPIEDFVRIEVPSAVISVIQPDGYKKWIEHPEYEVLKNASDKESARIKDICDRRMNSLAQTILSYLNFIRKWEFFRSGNSRPFQSDFEIFDFLIERGRIFRSTSLDAYADVSDDDFNESMDDWTSSDVLRETFKKAVISTQADIVFYFSSYEDANQRARALARRTGATMVLWKCDDRWAVASASGTDSNLDDLIGPAFEDKYGVKDRREERYSVGYEHDEPEYFDKYAEDTSREIQEEASEYGFGLSRSDEDGWFYED